MIALYGQDPATGEFGYIGQTEKMSSTSSPRFETKIRLDEVLGGGAAGGDGSTSSAGDRPLMMMVYDVADENNILEGDQVGTCALTWAYLLAQAGPNEDKPVRLPLLDNQGNQHPTATITVRIQRVQQ